MVPPILGSSQRLLNRDHYSTYYKDMPCATASGKVLRRHGDEMQRLPGGYYVALGRCDDTMNLGGIKVCMLQLVGSNGSNCIQRCRQWLFSVKP